MIKVCFMLAVCFIGTGLMASSVSPSQKILEEGNLKAQKISAKILEMAGKKSRCVGWIEKQFLADSFSKVKGFHHCMHTVLANESINAVMDLKPVDAGMPQECNWSMDGGMKKKFPKMRHGGGNHAIKASVKAFCGALFPMQKKPLRD